MYMHNVNSKNERDNHKHTDVLKNTNLFVFRFLSIVFSAFIKANYRLQDCKKHVIGVQLYSSQLAHLIPYPSSLVLIKTAVVLPAQFRIVLISIHAVETVISTINLTKNRLMRKQHKAIVVCAIILMRSSYYQRSAVMFFS